MCYHDKCTHLFQARSYFYLGNKPLNQRTKKKRKKEPCIALYLILIVARNNPSYTWIERDEKSKSSSALLFLQSWKTSFVVPSVPDAGEREFKPRRLRRNLHPRKLYRKYRCGWWWRVCHLWAYHLNRRRWWPKQELRWSKLPRRDILRCLNSGHSH